MAMPKIIVRVKGGLGNQLFIYAAAKSFAYRKGFLLKLDVISGFNNDPYNRSYRLNNFNIMAEIANYDESYLGVKGVIKRKIDKIISKFRGYKNSIYLQEESRSYDEKFFNNIQNSIYAEGYWQSEKYFKNIENVIRNELIIKSPIRDSVRKMAKEIKNRHAICIHVRRFEDDLINSNAHLCSLNKEYYVSAIDAINRDVDKPIFYIFGDNPKWFMKHVADNEDFIIVDNNKDYEDLFLMRQFGKFIISNSTFAWWGAWLSDVKGKKIITPHSPLNKDYYPISDNYITGDSISS